MFTPPAFPVLGDGHQQSTLSDLPKMKEPKPGKKLNSVARWCNCVSGLRTPFLRVYCKTLLDVY